MPNRPQSNNAYDRSPACPATWPERSPEKCRRPGPWLCACAEPCRRRSQCPPTPGPGVAEREAPGKQAFPPRGERKSPPPRTRREICRKLASSLFGKTHVGTAAPGCPAEQSSGSFLTRHHRIRIGLQRRLQRAFIGIAQLFHRRRHHHPAIQRDLYLIRNRLPDLFRGEPILARYLLDSLQTASVARDHDAARVLAEQNKLWRQSERCQNYSQPHS